MIDRLVHKKLADVGSRNVLSAWFNKDGSTLVMAEQFAIDELRIVVCVPQTLQVTIDESCHSITTQPLTKSVGLTLFYNGLSPRSSEECLILVIKLWGSTKGG